MSLFTHREDKMRVLVSEGQIIVGRHLLEGRGVAARVGGGAVGIRGVLGVVTACGGVALRLDERDLIGHDLGRVMAVALRVGPATGLQLATHEDRTALLEIARHELGALAPSNDGDKIGRLLLVLRVTRVRRARKAAVHSDGEAADRDLALGLSDFGIGGKIADQNDLLKLAIVVYTP